MDRAYRIGQHRDVVVYRLIMAAAIEEKMYEKQVGNICLLECYIHKLIYAIQLYYYVGI